jgi:RTX calcium-binding nonapeptide repeat (4 copies)
MRRARIAVVAAAGALGLLLGAPGQASATVACTFNSVTGAMTVTANDPNNDLPHIFRSPSAPPAPLPPVPNAILVFDVNPPPAAGSPGAFVQCMEGANPVFPTTAPEGGATTADSVTIAGTNYPAPTTPQTAALRPVITMAGGFFGPGKTDSGDTGQPATSLSREIEFTVTGFPAGYPTINGLPVGDLVVAGTLPAGHPAAGTGLINLNTAPEVFLASPPNPDPDVTVVGAASSIAMTGGSNAPGTTTNGGDELNASGTTPPVVNCLFIAPTPSQPTPPPCPVTGTASLTDNPGADILRGGSGNDPLFGGGGDDVYSGGDGTDTVSFLPTTSGVHVDLSHTGGQDTHEGRDAFAAVENVNGTGGDDDLHGTVFANVLTGGGGNDTIEGRGGDDTLAGGAGTNTLSYESADGGVTVDLRNGGAQNTGGAGTDTATDFHHLIGGNHADRLTGTDGPNTVTAGLGADTISTLGGDDSLPIRDGVGDNASCGDGADSVVADRPGVDTINPDCETTDPAAVASFSRGPGLTNDSTPLFGFSANESGVSFQCRVNRSQLVACPNPYTTTRLSDRSHLIEVTAVDAHGPDPILTGRQFTIDTLGPVLSGLRIDHRVVATAIAAAEAAQRRRTRARRSTRVRFSLSEAANVAIVFQRRTRGRRVGRRCRRETRRNRRGRRCVLYVIAGNLPAAGRVGRNSVRFTGRVRRGGSIPKSLSPDASPGPGGGGSPGRGRARTRRLPAGRYRVLVAARDRAGNVGRVVRAGLRIVKRPRRARRR